MTYFRYALQRCHNVPFPKTTLIIILLDMPCGVALMFLFPKQRRLPIFVDPPMEKIK
jgi:hypothetical protein